MIDNFYRAFEEKHRGSRALIKSRLKVYQPFLEPLLEVYPEANALDLGCGRGEWLEYVAELGIYGHGIDLDEGMLSACADLGISAEKNDLLGHLKHVDNDSLCLVSAFHVVEHISFDDLRTLVTEAMRVLKPGGLLIMETPNPENIVVATRNFYLDPTHQKPIPPELLAFVAEFTGFQRVKVMRLQEETELLQKEDVSLQELLNGVSPDYAIITQKQAPTEIKIKFNQAFEKNYGLALETLAARFDNRIIKVEAKVSETAASLDAVLNSKSWRITAPLRSVNQFSHRLLSGVRERKVATVLRRGGRSVIYRIGQKAMRSPRLKRVVMAILNRVPRLRERLRRILLGGAPSSTLSWPKSTHRALSPLSPRAARLYTELKCAIDSRKN